MKYTKQSNTEQRTYQAKLDNLLNLLDSVIQDTTIRLSLKQRNPETEILTTGYLNFAISLKHYLENAATDTLGLEFVYTRVQELVKNKQNNSESK